MSEHSPTARPVDHCVLPVENLDVAAKRLAALGFTVASRAQHPFGTANACVYFGDGSYLEPLSAGDEDRIGEARRSGNVFVERFSLYRQRHGREGFCALAMGTDNAAKDHDRFVRQGFSAGPELAFARPFVDEAGKESEAAFHLAFAAEPNVTSAFFFTCQRVNAPAAGRAALEAHANGAAGIRRIVAVADRPAAHDRILEAVTGVSARAGDGRVDFICANAVVSVQTSEAAGRRFDIAPLSGADEIRLAAIVLGVPALGRVRGLLADAAVEFSEIDGRVIVQPAPGQGAVLAFEEDTI